tara:strand:- start:96 stop:791 length:696 start_codon:yes stop_codon:yes gene_type:complete
MSNKIIITQSNYIPWKGYFTSMKKATHVILYDNAQYTRRDWRNRNKIITPNGPSWLSIPIDVKGKFHQKINEARVKDNKWSLDHWNKIVQNYKKAPCFDEYSIHFKDLYTKQLCEYEYLSDINRVMLQKCIDLLDIEIKVLDSREFDIRGGKTEKLINLCNDLEANEYFTGPAAKGYMEEDLFEKNNIKLTYYDLDGFPTYKQLWDGFDHYVSVLDMFFILGSETKEHFNW